ncbi:MAG: SPOR domain-containing protein [Bacteroidales bacterium]|nr:SPOR domain-containing protein [Bacteroidales bacterium]MCB8998859.1 SPOR domain-containing protein [Bacteroidales bacterium]MCB9014002.1 SPOR domain-containing protein [Bacteroidales bacterium]
MKTKFFFLVVISFSIISCGGTHKSRTKAVLQPAPAIIETPVKTEPEMAPIVEKKEKLIEIEDKPVDNHAYFVIIGSFKNPANAENFQKQIMKDGFNSVLLKNEAGLYRVSVKSTDDITAARNEIKRIRTGYKQYADTWLLISIR